MSSTLPQTSVGTANPTVAVPAHPILTEHNEPYEAVVRAAGAMHARRDPEAVLRHVDVAAKLASEFHAGRFADGAIENVALEIGSELDRWSPARHVDRMPAMPAATGQS